MRRIPLLLLMLSCAFAVDAAAQNPRPARDSIRMAEVEAEEPDTAEVSIDELEAAETDTVPKPVAGPYARSGGSGPFSVQASGEVAPRPERGEIVWVNAAPRAAADSSRRDTARTGSRVSASQPARRDTTAATRPAARDTARTGSRVSASQPARRDTAASARPTARDTARTGSRVTSSQPARRDTASRTRPPASRDTARTGQRVSSSSATRRDTSASTGTQRPATTTGRPGSTPAASGRARTHTVVAGETFYAIARRYGVTAAQLRALNPDVDMDALEVGDELRLPAGARDSRAGAQPRPQAPTTGGSTRPQAGSGAQTTQQPRRGTRSHVVQAGETLFGIARRYGVTVDAIRRANQMETDQVRAGQRIVIPPAS
ncbi:MAG TPA: LysM peptidoglycan-binding domain-containing protein [Longimicrobium sp.]|nr:LysM peptidoglycan-binding domain-containing protein [Longimicrobium sp.]